VTESIRNVMDSNKVVIIALGLSVVAQGVPRVGAPVTVQAGQAGAAAPAAAPPAGPPGGAYGAPPPGGAYSAPPPGGAYGAPAAGAYGAPAAGAYGAPAAGAYGAPPPGNARPYGAPPGAAAAGGAHAHAYRPAAGGAIARDANAPALTPIAQLNSYANRWTVRGRVTVKSDVRTYQNARGGGSFFSFDLLDAEGGEIRVVGWNDQCARFADQVQVCVLGWVGWVGVGGAGGCVCRSALRFCCWISSKKTLKTSALNAAFYTP
jgi:replication factor A1